MENSLDLVIVWAMYGTYMCKTFWPMPSTPHHPNTTTSEPHSIKWPKKAHPGALSETGPERTPWLTRWARATFEQGCLSVLPHLEGPCKALSLPGEQLFQASRMSPDRMRPVIFHAFGRAKHDAPKALDQLAQLGWKTLPIALLGMPHYPASWVDPKVPPPRPLQCICTQSGGGALEAGPNAKHGCPQTSSATTIANSLKDKGREGFNLCG